MSRPDEGAKRSPRRPYTPQDLLILAEPTTGRECAAKLNRTEHAVYAARRQRGIGGRRRNQPEREIILRPNGKQFKSKAPVTGWLLNDGAMVMVLRTHDVARATKVAEQVVGGEVRPWSVLSWQRSSLIAPSELAWVYDEVRGIPCVIFEV